MSRYIDANLLKEKILKERDKIPFALAERYTFGKPKPFREGEAMRGGIRKALRCLEQAPTADVVEVRHGEWIDVCTDTLYRFKCSLCDNVRLGIQTNYCCNCGAKMDGEKQSG